MWSASQVETREAAGLKRARTRAHPHPTCDGAFERKALELVAKGRVSPAKGLFRAERGTFTFHVEHGGGTCAWEARSFMVPMLAFHVEHWRLAEAGSDESRPLEPANP